MFIAFRSVKDHHNLPHYSQLLKRTCVRQVVLDKWLPLTQKTIHPALQVGAARGVAEGADSDAEEGAGSLRVARHLRCFALLYRSNTAILVCAYVMLICLWLWYVCVYVLLLLYYFVLLLYRIYSYDIRLYNILSYILYCTLLHSTTPYYTLH